MPNRGFSFVKIMMYVAEGEKLPAVPKHLKWDLWLGPAPERPYHPAYHPINWRGWWDFGNGRLGDMGCHPVDLAFSALDLKYPLTVEAEGPRVVGRQVAPRWLIAKWTFPRRGNLPPVEITWYDGNQRPELLNDVKPPDSQWPWYVAFVGAEGMVIAGMDRFKLYPEDKFAGVQRPQLVPRSIHHAQEWITACKTGSRAGTHFGYSGPLTETVLLGTVAYRAGRKLEWDAENLKVTNCAEANQFLQRENRKGWTL
jgi:predicted dehydrogenase